MKGKHKLMLFAVCAMISCNMLSSCSSRKVGFFNYSSSPYYVKDKAINKENAMASAGEMPLLVSSQEEILAVPKSASVEKLFSKAEGKDRHTIKENTFPEKKIGKEEKKEIRGILKKEKAQRTNVIGKVLLVIFAIILPPLAVALVDGLTGPFWLDILLTILFYVPGLIYALYRIFRTS